MGRAGVERTSDALMRVEDDFEAADGALDARWARTCPGGGRLVVADSALRLELPGATRERYSDAQIDDYSGLARSRFPWCPPLRLEARVRASHPAHPPLPPALALPAPAKQRFLRGTAGFGFWNYPLSLTGSILRLPDAIWFFAASPPSNMALVPGVPGWGWKAQVVHAQRLGAALAGVPALGAIVRARLSGDVAHAASAARWTQRVSGAHEALLDAERAGLDEWHTYTLEWRREVARFWVDGAEALAVARPPQGPLGFVAWIDNQYAVATPRGEFGFGYLASGPEWLALDSLRITQGEN